MAGTLVRTFAFRSVGRDMFLLSFVGGTEFIVHHFLALKDIESPPVVFSPALDKIRVRSYFGVIILLSILILFCVAKGPKLLEKYVIYFLDIFCDWNSQSS